MIRRTAIGLALLVATVSGSPRAQAKDAIPATTNLREVPFPRVRIADTFFAPRRATNRKVTLRHALAQLEETGTLANFDRAAKGEHTGYQGFVFQDSDAYKALEAIAYSLLEERDPELEAAFDAVVARMAAAQQPDGYLNTAYVVQHEGKRFVNLRDDHELYCAGHLFEAAAAHFVATGKRNLLDVAVRYADLLVRTFGGGAGKREGYCGHPEIELALVQLANVTGERSYLELAKHFVDTRGDGFFAREHGDDPARYDGTYWLDHRKVRDLPALAGHAVRAAYLMSGAVDVAAAFDDRALLLSVQRVYDHTSQKNVFLTGGIGPSASNEGFTRDFDLPTATAYQESCASIGVAMWAHRLNLTTGDARYADAVETALYNAIPAGVQLDGTKFFYVNPLASRGTHHRRAWFGCACCPPNLARTFARLGGYVAATSADSLYVNLFVEGEIRAQLGADEFAFAVTTEYPWNGLVTLRCLVAPAREVALRLRVPGWSEGARVRCNQQVMQQPQKPSDGYFEVRRTFAKGDVVELDLPMRVRTIVADPRAEALRGKVAFARGPLVYCAERCDQTVEVTELIAQPGSQLVSELRPDLLHGIVVLRGELLASGPQAWEAGALYRSRPEPRRVPVTLVPYAVWDNREPGAMAVWLPEASPMPRLVGPEVHAKIELSFTSNYCDPEGLRDGEEPRRSGDTPKQNCHFWPHKGGTESATYVWPEPRAVAGCRVFWFDDEGHGECRLPNAARLSYRDASGAWHLVEVAGVPLAIEKDRWCEVAFAPVMASSLRLELDQREGFATGVLEWQVVAADDRR